ncbi:MAG: TorF family putative porin [Amphritea sp.]|nr:TorF family putative porin [Amphritea sp.]
MKTCFIVSAALLLSASVQATEVSGTIGFTNDYRFHGISQSSGDPAVQGSLDAAFDNGVYVGAWGSNVDFGDGDDAHLEIDWYAGYGAEINDDMSWDATVYYYTYPGYSFNGEYAEIAVNLYYGDLTLGYAYANDYFNLSETGQYVGLDYSMSVTEEVSLDLHAGHSFGSYWTDLDIGAYSDFSVGLSGSVAGLDLAAAYQFNDIDAGMDVDSGAFRNDDTVVVSVSRSF